MSIADIDIRIEDLQARGAKPLTRARAVTLANGFAGKDDVQVNIRVTELKQFPDEDPCRYPVARVELRRPPNQSWCLQYVSRPGQTKGLTAHVHPSFEDYYAYFAARHELQLLPATRVHCAKQLVEWDYGPYDALCLRPSLPAPMVPKWREFGTF